MTPIGKVTGAAVAVILAVAAGCGGDGGGGGSTSSSPSNPQVSQAQQGQAASAPVSQATDAATEAILDGGIGGATTSIPAAPAVGFNWQGSINITLDLDAADSQGNDRYPNVTGRISVAASGTVTGTGSSGLAAYAVQVTTLTDVVYTDPYSASQGRIQAGASWSYGLDVSWTWTDSLHWSITTSSNALLSGLRASVTDGSSTVSATVNSTRDVAGSVSRSAGAISRSRSATAHTEITLTDGTTTHVIVIDTQGPTNIVITVDGVVLGPYTAAQVISSFKMLIL